MQMKYNSIFPTIASKHEYNAMESFQTTANIRKARDKFCLLSFKHRNKIGLLTPFAKISKRLLLKLRCKWVEKKI